MPEGKNSANHKLLQQRVAKLLKSVMHHHSVYEKEEQKRIEKLSKDRIKALRADDEEAYLKLIDQEKRIPVLPICFVKLMNS